MAITGAVEMAATGRDRPRRHGHVHETNDSTTDTRHSHGLGFDAMPALVSKPFGGFARSVVAPSWVPVIDRDSVIASNAASIWVT
jgi:hypothetical protein